jgi:CO/xanthine dehydrogenase Mo-binding subunit
VYEIPHVKVDVYMVYTNNVPGGAFRGFGSPQGVFSAEQQMDKLAEKLGLDAITIREKNLLRVKSVMSVGTALPSDLRLDKLLHECALKAGWTKTAGGWASPAIEQPSNSRCKRGSGIAIGFKNVGFSYGYPDKSSIKLELNGGADIEEVIVFYSGAECGQGTQTAIQQITADALQVPVEKIRLSMADTKIAPEAGSASASRLTFMAGNAVLGAAKEVMKCWQDEERPAVASYTYHAPPTTKNDPQTGRSVPNFAYGTVAQAVDVEVDTELGKVTCLRCVSAIDAGKAINPLAIEGQIEGGLAQGLGYTLMEDFRVEDSYIQTSNLSTYLIPTAIDMPPAVETIILEIPEPAGPGGARGIGENAMLGVAPAVATAIKQAIGVWFTSLPLTPQKVISGLKDHS